MSRNLVGLGLLVSAFVATAGWLLLDGDHREDGAGERTPALGAVESRVEAPVGDDLARSTVATHEPSALPSRETPTTDESVQRSSSSASRPSGNGVRFFDARRALLSAVEAGDARTARSALEQLLDAGDETESRLATEELLDAVGRGGAADLRLAAEAIADLARSLDDPRSLDGRSGAAAALTDSLFESLYAGNVPSFFQILDALTEIGPDQAAGDLARVVADRNDSTRVRSLAAEGLGVLKADSTVETLIATFEGPNARLAGATATSLARIGGPAAFETLLGALDGGSPAQLSGAARALAFHAGADGREAILDEVRSRPAVREGVCSVVSGSYEFLVACGFL